MARCAHAMTLTLMTMVSQLRWSGKLLAAFADRLVPACCPVACSTDHKLKVVRHTAVAGAFATPCSFNVPSDAKPSASGTAVH